MGADGDEETADVVLEQHDQGECAYADEFVEDGTEQSHLEHLGDDNPESEEDEDAIEDVERAGVAHQAVDVVEQEGDKENVDGVFDSEIEGHDDGGWKWMITLAYKKRKMGSLFGSKEGT